MMMSLEGPDAGFSGRQAFHLFTAAAASGDTVTQHDIVQVLRQKKMYLCLILIVYVT